MFALKLNYNKPEQGLIGVKPLYNGNISEQIWTSAIDNKKRGYGYVYDGANRLVLGSFKAPDLNSASTASLFDEKLEYDKNGNILKLDRNGASLAGVTTVIDKLTYGYESGSNRLSTVRDASGNQEGFKQVNTTGADYAYDEFGNLISDKHKKITKIKYNHLNLPVEINFGADKIEYLYTASGEKTQKKVTEKGVVTLTDYLGGFQYVKGKLSFLPTAEGFFNAETNAYVYQYKDHLGNVRLSYSDKSGDNTIQSSTEIIEETNYYPFGLAHKGYNQKNDALMKDYKYQYNGKEKQEELGLNFYDYGARNYDAAIGRWMSVDPLAEKYMRFTPYVYVANNPIMFIDPDGRKIVPTGMTPTQRKAYDSRINDVRGTNKMFNTIYSSLESSSKTHTIGFGSTISVNGNTVPGQVSPTSTGSSVVFENEGSFNNNPVLFEEFFHAYQIDNGLDNSGLNLEFEAKVGTTFMNEGTINDDGMDFDFEFEIFDMTLDNNLEKVNSKEFSESYKNAANKFSKYNIDNNVGTSNYKKETSSEPNNLKKMINETNTK